MLLSGARGYVRGTRRAFRELTRARKRSRIVEETRRDHAIGNQGVRCAGQAAQIGAGPYDRHSVIPGLDNAVPVSLER